MLKVALCPDGPGLCTMLHIPFPGMWYKSVQRNVEQRGAAARVATGRCPNPARPTWPGSWYKFTESGSSPAPGGFAFCAPADISPSSCIILHVDLKFKNHPRSIMQAMGGMRVRERSSRNGARGSGGVHAEKDEEGGHVPRAVR